VLSYCQVFLFLVNGKGSSWAYASPGFGAALQPGKLPCMHQASESCWPSSANCSTLRLACDERHEEFMADFLCCGECTCRAHPVPQRGAITRHQQPICLRSHDARRTGDPGIDRGSPGYQQKFFVCFSQIISCLGWCLDAGC
jgi:hypothetical protein